MTGVRMTIDAGDVSHRLAEAIDRLSHPKPLFENIGRSLVVSTQRRFELERDPAGNPWPMSIRAMMQGGRTLFDTGALAGSITFEATDTQVEIGTNAISAAVHQYGATIVPRQAAALRFTIGGHVVFSQRSVIPARPFIGLDEDDETEIEALAHDYIVSQALIPENRDAR